MPNKKWKHHCPNRGGAEITLGKEVCDDCGQRGEFAGWGHSMVEAMGAYQRRTGLKPIGPHRSLADKILAGHYKPCPTCHGSGLVEDADGENAHWCPMCQGKEYLFDGTPEEETALMDEIRKEYPDAFQAAQFHFVRKDSKEDS